MRRGPSFLRGLVICAILLALAAASYSLWLPWFGRLLIHDESPEIAEIAVVLGGDVHGLRILGAGQLVRAGYVPAALISGPPLLDISECTVTIQFAVRQGYPADSFIAFPNPALSTREEAGVIVKELRRRHIHRFLLVTSDFHTARARRLYLSTIGSTGGGIDFRTIGVAERYFRSDTWWQNRESQKEVFFEWCKTIATALGK